MASLATAVEHLESLIHQFVT